jgi:hypothetical protein
MVLLQTAEFTKLGVAGIICLLLSISTVTLWIAWKDERAARKKDNDSAVGEIKELRDKYEKAMELKNKEIRDIELESVTTLEKVTQLLNKVYESVLRIQRP